MGEIREREEEEENWEKERVIASFFKREEGILEVMVHRAIHGSGWQRRAIDSDGILTKKRIPKTKQTKD